MGFFAGEETFFVLSGPARRLYSVAAALEKFRELLN